jgi:hypothetical protein
MIDHLNDQARKRNTLGHITGLCCAHYFEKRRKLNNDHRITADHGTLMDHDEARAAELPSCALDHQISDGVRKSIHEICVGMEIAIESITERVTSESHSSRREYRREEAEPLAESFDPDPSLGDQSTPRGFRRFLWGIRRMVHAPDLIKSSYGLRVLVKKAQLPYK